LAEAGVEETWFRQTQYMTAITKCYPGRANNGSGDRVPSRVEQNLCRPFLEAEISFVDPELVIPVGRLAINLYYAKNLSLKEIIGSQKQVEGRWVVPLPHPSGASRWHQSQENQQLISQAVRWIGDQINRLF
jgi:uracil-DNA glycosylase